MIPCIPNPKSEIGNPKSRRSRHGVSILEVIFAILVTTVGLLAALTVFPVAAHIARKGRISDETAIAGRAAVHIFDARGMRRPDMWLMYDPTQGGGAFVNVNPLAGTNWSHVSFCIDPRLITNGRNDDLSVPAYPTRAVFFPYPSAAAGDPRMIRIGLTNGIPCSPTGVLPVFIAPLISSPQANTLFTFADDLTLVRPKDGSLPGFGTFTQVDSNNDGTPDLMTTRSTEGHLSWMATLVPKHELYAPTMVGTDQYVLSIVVFFDRPLVDFSIDLAPPPAPPYTTAHTDDTMYNTSERVVGVNFADAGGLGFAGGETFLIWPPDGTAVVNNLANQTAASRMLKVRAGDWIMLAGNTLRSPGLPTNVFKWYRVTEADHEPEYHGGAEQHYALAVSLAGQDWDAANLTQQQAFIITGVVGVYEKTVRLESGTGF